MDAIGAGERLTEKRLFKICGPTEAELQQFLQRLPRFPDQRVEIRAVPPDLTVSISGRDAHALDDLTRRLRDLLGRDIYSESEQSLEETVGQLLLARHQVLALAESCTGGLISHRITRIAGSSAYYYGGAVTYSNEAKVEFLGVDPRTLERHGAVSRETALEMSRGIRKRSGAGIGLSVTGVAGPGGGSIDKPVGTVWMSIAMESMHEAELHRFEGGREEIIRATSQKALNWIRLALL